MTGPNISLDTKISNLFIGLQCSPAIKGKTVRVKDGDTLSKIVKKNYPQVKTPKGARKLAVQLAALNNISDDPDQLRIGQRIKLPIFTVCDKLIPGAAVERTANFLKTDTDGNLSGAGTIVDPKDVENPSANIEGWY